MHLSKCSILYNMYLAQKIYIGETGRRLGDCFREHLRNVERNVKDQSPIILNNTARCDLSLHQVNAESCKI